MIDTHTHFFPDFIAEKTIGKLGARAGKIPKTNGTAVDTIKKMKEWGVRECWLMSIATNEKQMKNVNDFALSQKSDMIYPFASVYPNSSMALSELERVYKLGFRGIKLHPEYQQFEVSDAKVYPIYEYILLHNMILTFHAGRDCAYKDTYMASPKSILKVLNDFKGIKIVAAHLGGEGVWQEVMDTLMGKDIYFDTACLSGKIFDNDLKKILSGHSKERILLASDCPWSSPLTELRLIERYLSDKDLEFIVDKNAEDLKASVERG